MAGGTVVSAPFRDLACAARARERRRRPLISACQTRRATVCGRRAGARMASLPADDLTAARSQLASLLGLKLRSTGNALAEISSDVMEELLKASSADNGAAPTGGHNGAAPRGGHSDVENEPLEAAETTKPPKWLPAASAEWERTCGGQSSTLPVVDTVQSRACSVPRRIERSRRRRQAHLAWLASRNGLGSSTPAKGASGGVATVMNESAAAPAVGWSQQQPPPSDMALPGGKRRRWRCAKATGPASASSARIITSVTEEAPAVIVADRADDERSMSVNGIDLSCFDLKSLRDRCESPPALTPMSSLAFHV